MAKPSKDFDLQFRTAAEAIKGDWFQQTLGEIKRILRQRHLALRAVETAQELDPEGYFHRVRLLSRVRQALRAQIADLHSAVEIVDEAIALSTAAGLVSLDDAVSQLGGVSPEQGPPPSTIPEA